MGYNLMRKTIGFHDRYHIIFWHCI
uniref:Uncharacterized protein n=1 Tax=Arundo donax TaxID=35708 RepID=A0A0A9FT69_ARUDO